MRRGWAWGSAVLALMGASLAGCSRGDSFTGSTVCNWRPDAPSQEQFNPSTPHVCLSGSGPRYRLVATHFNAGSDLRVDLTSEPLGNVVVLHVDADGNAQTVIRAGGQVRISGTGADNEPFGTLITASGGPLPPN